jgi:hypothetical protein
MDRDGRTVNSYSIFLDGALNNKFSTLIMGLKIAMAPRVIVLTVIGDSEFSFNNKYD